MQILLSCAKTMAENNPAEIPRTTLPRYAREAAELALQLATLSTEELERMLRTNRQIAATNRRRYRQFHGEEALPRCWPTRASYSGISPRSDSPPGISNTHSSTSTSRRSSTAAPAAGRNPPLPAGRGRRIAGARRPNDVRVLAGTADRSLPRKNPCRRRHPWSTSPAAR